MIYNVQYTYRYGPLNIASSRRAKSLDEISLPSNIKRNTSSSGHGSTPTRCKILAFNQALSDGLFFSLDFEVFHSFRCWKAMSHAEPLMSLPWACLEANLILPNTSHFQPVCTPRSTRKNLHRWHPSILTTKLFFYSRRIMSALGEVRGTQKQCHSRNGNCLATGSLLLNEMDELQTYRMMIVSFSVFPVFFFPKKKKRKKMENGLPQQYRWPWPSGWWSCCPCPESVKVMHQKEINGQHGRNIDPNLLLESVVTLLAKGFMENEQNFESSLLLSRIKDSVETIGLRPPGTVRNPIKNCNCNLLPPASPQQ